MFKATDLENKIYQDLKKRESISDDPNRYLQDASDFSLNYQLNHHDELQMDYHEYLKQFFISREEIEDYSVALGNATLFNTSAMFESKDANQLYKLTVKGHHDPIDINQLQTYIGEENQITVMPVEASDQKIAFHIIDSMIYQIGV